MYLRPVPLNELAEGSVGSTRLSQLCKARTPDGSIGIPCVTTTKVMDYN